MFGINASQKAFWQAIVVGDLESVKYYLENAEQEEVKVNMYDEDGEQRSGVNALHLAILEMPTWKSIETGGLIDLQRLEYIKEFFETLLKHGARDYDPCLYEGTWYLKVREGKTKGFKPFGYDSIGMILQFMEILNGVDDEIGGRVARRLELVRNILLENRRKGTRPDMRSRFQSHEPINGYYPDDLFSLCDDMRQSLTSSKFSDVVIRCENGKEFNCHKAILAARSVYFEKMFTLPLSESSSGVVEMKEIDSDTFEAFLQYIYTGKVENDQFDKMALLDCANRFDVPSLRNFCCGLLADGLNVDNAASMLSVANKLNCEKLQRLVVVYIRKNIERFMSTAGYAALEHKLLQAIMPPKQELDSKVSTQSETSKKRKVG